MTTESPTQVTQTEIYSLQDGDSNYFDREIKAIKLSFGKLVVSGNGKDAILTDEDEVTFDNASAVKVFAPEGPCSFAVTFADNAVMPVFQNATALPAELHHDAAVQEDEKPKRDSARRRTKQSASRGDTGGQTGSFDSRTVTELRGLAKERGVTVKGKNGKKPIKSDFIKALRG